MRIALGLFHFNIQDVAGEPAAYHRYCTQVVLPFLRAIASRREYRATFEMAGNGLEFLAENYPAAIELLRSLIAENKIELISATYAPTLWVAFPLRDLEQSIKLNLQVLERLRLPASRIFSAQEGFFGPGVEALGEWFDTAVCKDDTLRHLADEPARRPVYKLGNVTIVIGANHILHELAAGIIRASQEERPLEISSFHEAHIQEAVNSASHSAAEYIDGTAHGMEWHWYHTGSAHHFTTTGAPHNWEAFFCEPDWMAMNCGIFDSLLAQGYCMGFISEWASRMTAEGAEMLPAMIEGSWSPNRSRGVAVWMGRQEHRWQGGASVLTLAWRARKALRQCESAVDRVVDLVRRRELQCELEEIWKQQILAESSDPMGWAPLPGEVNFGREQSDRVLQMCASLMTRLCPHAPCSEKRTGPRLDTPVVAAEVLGGEGNIEWRQVAEDLYVCEARFRADENFCGIRFRRETDSIVYCPSGLEQQPTTLTLTRFQQPELYLPLANGFVSVRDDLHLIRENCSVAVAARVPTKESWITFAVEGGPEGRVYAWRFFLSRGSAMEAARLANRINSI